MSKILLVETPFVCFIFFYEKATLLSYAGEHN